MASPGFPCVRAFFVARNHRRARKLGAHVRAAARQRRPRCVSAPAVAVASPTRGFPPRILAPGRDAFGRLLALRFVREGPRGQQVGESQLVGQIQQRHLVPEMGPRSASIPTPYGVRDRSRDGERSPPTAAPTPPGAAPVAPGSREARRRLFCCGLFAFSTLSGPSAGRKPQAGRRAERKRPQSAPSRSPGGGHRLLAKGCGGPPISFHVCGLFSLPSTGPDR